MNSNMKFKMIDVFTLTFLMSFALFPVSGHTKDFISLNLCDEINTRVPSEFNAVSTLDGKSQYYIWAHMKFEPDGRLQAETYYLEWLYNNGQVEIVMDNYNKNEKLKYTRTVNYSDDYWWVIKTIYDDKPGEYIFRIYVKDDGKLTKIAEKALIVEK